METMYWIDVIGNISTTAVILAVLSAITALICLIVVGVAIDLGERNDVAFGKKWFKRLGVTSVIFMIAAAFTPSTKSMYMIYGVGSTIDYLKDNETAKQLPDKVIIALDKYIDCLNEDKEKND